MLTAPVLVELINTRTVGVGFSPGYPAELRAAYSYSSRPLTPQSDTDCPVGPPCMTLSPLSMPYLHRAPNICSSLTLSPTSSHRRRSSGARRELPVFTPAGILTTDLCCRHLSTRGSSSRDRERAKAEVHAARGLHKDMLAAPAPNGWTWELQSDS